MIQKDNMQKKCEYRYGYVFKQLSNPLQSWPADLYGWPELLTSLVTCDDKAIDDFMTMITLDVYCGGD